MNCPICGSVFAREDIKTGKPPRNWFWGDCRCLKCGLVRVNGTAGKNGKREIIYWHPACADHGINPVIAIDRSCNRFLCTSCRRVLEVDRGRLIVAVDPPEAPCLRSASAG